jgi:hypothetical protein
MSKKITDKIVPGALIEVGYPFVIEVDQFDATNSRWKPGCTFDSPDDDSRSRAVAFADAMGTQILTVVSVHKPGKYLTRVFFTQRWRDPGGAEWGKDKLHVKALGAFRKMLKGYRYRFEIDGADQTQLAAPLPQIERVAS